VLSQLFHDVAPKTAENFRALCTGILNFNLFPDHSFCFQKLPFLPSQSCAIQANRFLDMFMYYPSMQILFMLLVASWSSLAICLPIERCTYPPPFSVIDCFQEREVSVQILENCFTTRVLFSIIL